MSNNQSELIRQACNKFESDVVESKRDIPTPLARVPLTRKQVRETRNLQRKVQALLVERHKRKLVAKERRELTVKLARSSHFVDKIFVDDSDEAVPEFQSGLHNTMTTGAAVCASAAIAGLCYQLLKVAKTSGETTARVLDDISAAVGTHQHGELASPSTLRGASDRVSGLVDSISKAFHSFVQTIKSIAFGWWTVPAALLLYAIMQQVGFSPIISTVISYVGSIFLPGLWDSIKEYFWPSTTVETQSGFTKHVPFVTSLVCAACVPGRGGPKVMAGELMKRMSYVEKSTSGIQFVFDNLLRIAEAGVNTILSLFGRDEVQWTDQTDRMLQGWADKVDAFEKLTIVNSTVSIDEINKAMALLQEGIGFRQILRATHSRNFVDKYVDRLSSALQAHKGAIDAAGSFRQQPVLCLLGGGSGVGKTSVLKALASSVLLLSGEVPAKEAIQNMWQKGTTEYWNGYVQQKCLIMDDCFQLKMNGNTPDNEAMMIIRAIGNFAYPINFADVESKGRFKFASPLVIGTTNVRNIKSECDRVIAEPEAVVRRIQYGYWVYVSPEYLKEKVLDYERISREFRENIQALKPGCSRDDVIDCFPWKAWRLAQHGFAGESPQIEHCGDYGLRELAMDMAADLRKRKVTHQEEVDTLTQWLNAIETADILPQSGVQDSDSSDSEEREISVAPVAPSIKALPPRKRVPPVSLGKLVGVHSVPLEKLETGFPPFKPHQVPGEPRTRHWCEGDADCLADFDSARASTAGTLDHPDLGGITGPFDEFDSASQQERDWWHHEHTDFQFRRNRLCEHIGVVRAERKEFNEGKRHRLKWLRDANGWIVRTVISIPEHLFTLIGLTTNTSAAPRYKDAVAGLLSSAALLYIWFRFFGFINDMLVAAAKTIIRTVASLFGRDSEEQSNTKEGQPKNRARVKGMPRFAEQQLGNPPKDVMGDIMYHNTYKVLTDKGSLGQILFLEGSLAVMPAHFDRDLELLEPGSQMSFHSCHQDRFHFKLDVAVFKKLPRVGIEGVDVVYLDFGHAILKAHQTITHLLLTEAQMAQVLRQRDTPVRLDVARTHEYGNELRITRHTYCSPTIKHCGDIMVGDSMRSGLIEYVAQTVSGDCGAPLSISEPRYWGGRALLGIHVAGYSGPLHRLGYSTIVTQENAIHARRALEVYQDKFAEDLAGQNLAFTPSCTETAAAAAQGGLATGSMLHIGSVDQSLHMSGKSKIKRSPMYGLYGDCPTEVAHLRSVMVDGVRVQPMARAMEAYQSPFEYREIPLMDAIVDMATRPHWEATKDSQRTILTPEEAVKSVEGLKLKKIPRDTSSGYPYRLSGLPGKKEFFGDGAEYELEGERWDFLLSRVEYVIDSAKRNIRLAHIFSDFLKDELRPIAKVEAVASRAISGAPTDYVIAVRMYFGCFLAAMFKHHTTTGMAPGINHYTEWHILANELNRFGNKKVFGGDFSRFDASEQPYIHMRILAYINRWYRYNNPEWSPEDDRVRNILWLDLIHSRHLAGLNGRIDQVIQWNKSLPSGHPLTTPVNSLYSLITLTACYVHSGEVKDVRGMWDNVFICTYGDDNVNAVSDAVSEVFNQVTVAKLMKDLFNLDYTSDKKGQELVPYAPIEEVTFLKRSFKRDDLCEGGWVAPLAIDSFLYIPYWFKNPRDVAGDLNRNMEQMFGELCLYDVEDWDLRYAQVEAWVIEAGMTMPFLTREAARDWIKSRTDVWY